MTAWEGAAVMRLLPALLLLISCATVSSETSASGPVVVSRFGDRRISIAEVDAKAGDDLFKLQEQLFDLRVETAERIAIELLVEERAKREGVSPDQWVESRLDVGVRPPSETELTALYEKVRSRLPPEARFEDVKPQLVQAVLRETRGKRARELFDEIKKEAGYTVLLDAPTQPRKSVMGSGPSRGDSSAKISIVVFADFQCPYCNKASETVDRVMAAYPGQVRLTYRHFPLSFHKEAPKAAEASMCAAQQGKFWEYHDALYSHQDALSVDDLKGHAFAMGLDLKRFEGCLDSGEMKAVVQTDQKEGERLGVSGTPAFFVNGFMLSGAQPEEKFKRIIDKELAK